MEWPATRAAPGNKGKPGWRGPCFHRDPVKPEPQDEVPAMAIDEVYTRLREILVEQFGKAPEAVTRDSTLRGGLMLDSLDLMDLAAYIQRSFGVDADGQALREAHTLAGLARWVRERHRIAA